VPFSGVGWHPAQNEVVSCAFARRPRHDSERSSPVMGCPYPCRLGLARLTLGRATYGGRHAPVQRSGHAVPRRSDLRRRASSSSGWRRNDDPLLLDGGSAERIVEATYRVPDQAALRCKLDMTSAAWDFRTLVVTVHVGGRATYRINHSPKVWNR
jgi:hypothetical protein